jgi:hypothetical protein
MHKVWLTFRAGLSYRLQAWTLTFVRLSVMDKLEIKQGTFIQQTQYFIPVEIAPARLGIWFFHLSHRTTVIQDLLVRRKWNARSKLFYCIYCSSIWSSRTLTKLISQSQKRFRERKYQYLKYKNKNHSGTDT